MRNQKLLSAILLILIASTALGATSTTRINNDACFSQKGQRGIDACVEFVDAVGRDLHRLNTNAQALEELGRFESAARLYTAAAAYFPNDKRALQGLVRSRANARARRIIADLEPEPEEISPCWSERWTKAFEACRQETRSRTNDPRLHERLGDVARSVGDVTAAQQAYAKSLELQPDNPNLHRKRNALTQLLAGSDRQSRDNVSAGVVDSNPMPIVRQAAQPETKQRNEFALPDNQATIRKLELLEALKARNLVSAQEYQKQRSALLEGAFVDAPANDTGSRYRGLQKGRYLAVVIGNNRYAEFPQLETAAADATAMSDILQTRYGFEVTTLINADRYQILTALSDLRAEATEDDSILLYYAGHGLLDDAADRGYWLPIDAEKSNFARWISTTDIAGMFAGAPARHALVIADSCFAGTLLRSADATGFETLQRLAAKRSRTVLTSGGLEPVVDDGNGENSVFAAALLDALRANDSVLEASKLFATVRDEVVRHADQTPQYAPMQSARHDGGDFLFIPAIFPKTVSRASGTY